MRALEAALSRTGRLRRKHSAALNIRSAEGRLLP
jgi:hypothetical protein